MSADDIAGITFTSSFCLIAIIAAITLAHYWWSR